MGDPAATPRLRLILDEMFPAVIAEALRVDGYDVIAVQENNELRELTDADLFATAQRLERAVVTKNVKDFIPIDATSHTRGEPHWGLILTTNRSFPRHRNRFIGAATKTLIVLLDHHSESTAISAIYWLRPAEADQP